MKIVQQDSKKDTGLPKWYYKSYGRIFVQCEEHKEHIIEYLKANETFEYDYFKPNLIAVNPPDDEWRDVVLVYQSKFDPNIERLVEFLNEKFIKFEIISFPSSGIHDGYCESLRERYGPNTKFYW